MFASLRNRWWIVIASMFGLMVVGGTINTFAFAVYLKPVANDLGISRSVMASGVLLTNAVSGLLTPFMGSLIDRCGCRKVLLPGIPLFALTIAAFSVVQSSPVFMYTLFAMAGLAGAAQNTVPYASVISKWFDHERGLALGIAMAGIGFGIAIVPQLAQTMIELAGWRISYVGLGAIIMVFAFVPVFLFVREPAASDLPRSNDGQGSELVGLGAKQVFLGEWRFWVMSAGFFVAVVSTNGTLVHLVAMLTDRGMSEAQATAALSVGGIGVILGRLICGWCLDRFYGPNVAVCIFVIPAIGIGGLASGAGGIVPIAGAALSGIGLGANLGLMAFFASRYFGLRAYGKVFGVMFGLFLIGSGAGPFLSGLSFDLLHSYQPALIAFGLDLLVVAGLFALLGPYRFAPRVAPIEEVVPVDARPAAGTVGSIFLAGRTMSNQRG